MFCKKTSSEKNREISRKFTKEGLKQRKFLNQISLILSEELCCRTLANCYLPQNPDPLTYLVIVFALKIDKGKM